MYGLYGRQAGRQAGWLPDAVMAWLQLVGMGFDWIGLDWTGLAVTHLDWGQACVYVCVRVNIRSRGLAAVPVGYTSAMMSWFMRAAVTPVCRYIPVSCLWQITSGAAGPSCCSSGSGSLSRVHVCLPVLQGPCIVSEACVRCVFARVSLRSSCALGPEDPL